VTVAYVRQRGDRQVHVCSDDGASFCEDSWRFFHRMGSGPGIELKKAHQSIGLTGQVYDARVLDAGAEAELAGLDAALQAAHSARAEWLRERFRTWPPLTRDNAAKVVPGTPKSVVARQLRDAPKPSATALAAERKTLAGLNRALRG
jgi:hypothetical protein